MTELVTPDDLSTIRDITDAMGRLERSLRALGDGLELAADTLTRTNPDRDRLLSDDDRARLHGRAFQRTLEEIGELPVIDDPG